ncbi:receptor-like serine/threonine-protein kinase SD1-8 isoform X2 [Malus sylvestris]|uniref:receptor-like serine/threonine-protein kinase SD1-8 isoform X2 n=1 Tax=Malus sylvestris TaxID=3752 RepID=UPI0021AC48E1|nr:receptor-like serine/threonine-protein kinase SD1-8 isoform X2 [Malus sylvestris]
MNTKPNSKFSLSVILLCAFLESHVSFAADTISENHSLSGDQTVVSAGGMFELGFFKPGQLSNYYIGIWYSKQVVSEMTIVWVANREIPVSDRFSSALTILDGNLVLLNMSKNPVWSTDLNSTTSSGSVQAVLLDSGNLVLIAGSSNNTSEPLWQSFDHPTHTLLPGGKLGFNKITNHTQILTSWKSLEDPAPGLYSLELAPDESNSYILLWNRSRQYWTTGPWNESSHNFNLIPEMSIVNIWDYTIFNYSYVTNENESYFTYSPKNPKIVSRYSMSASGQIQILKMENSKQWKLVWSQPRQCDVYASCGAFSSCKPTSLNYCKCLKGFVPNRQSDWDLQIYSGGCSRRTSVKCGNATGDGFLKVNSKSLPDNRQYEGALSIESCRSACLNECQCTAYNYGSGNGCSLWHGDVLNLHEVEANEGDRSTLYIRAAASDIKEKRVIKPSLLIAIVSTITGLIVVVFGCFLWKKTTGKKREQKKNHNESKSKIDVGGGGGRDDAELPIFGLRAVVAATNNFAEANKLGEGGFGPVYKGILSENQEVGIKRLSKKSGQGHEEFMNELKLIAKLQHTNLVRLLGCCLEDEEMILIYEYMPNRSLDKLLFDASEKIELNWGRRFRIIEGIAQGVLYIHKYSRLKIIHRDLKASNILLDEALNPKISDFGMARIFGINQTEANTNRVVGTYGYMSPEYARYGHFSEKLDVFSFGVLLLEIVSGKKNAAFYRFEHSPTLAGWAWELWKEGRGMEVIDESIRETCHLDEALRCIHVGFLCVQEAPADRPTMSSVIHMLQGNESTSLPPSKELAFSTHRNSNHVRSSEMPTIFSHNSVTMSLPECR